MDEANQLVQALQVKLCELDHKIWKYRQDMIAEFDRYAAGLLNDVPTHLSETVLESIKGSKKLHRSLYPEADTDAHTQSPVESCAAAAAGDNTTTPAALHNGIAAERSTSPTTMLMPTPTTERSGGEGEKDSSPRDPHRRDKEFQGVFTPQYLPLLDDSDRNERRSSAPCDTPTSPKSDTRGKGKQIEGDVTYADASTDIRSLQSSPQTTRPPIPKRRNTDEVSIKSDWSDGPRRSALRRESSTSKAHSPRRVRFEVEGEEVLPTVSPAQVISPLGDIAGMSFDESFEEVDEEAGSEQIEDVEEMPIPKRVSSTQALRALSRNPLEDDGTQWTTVSAPPDGSASVATTNGFSYGSEEDLPVFGSSLSRGLRMASMNGDSAAKEHASQLPKTPSDDEGLDIMSPLRRQRQSSASMLSPAIPADIEGNKTPTSSTRSTGAVWKDIKSFGGTERTPKDNELLFDDDQEVMFNFDENIPPPGQPLPRQDDPEEEEEEEDDSDSEPELLIKSRRPSSQASSYSRSPAREIPKPGASSQSHSSTPTPTMTGVVGSFKGKPFGMEIVNKELHDRAADMGAVDTTFGSVRDALRGSNGGDGASYGRSTGGVGSFSGGPRSFSERAMMDDIMEAEEERRSRNGSGGKDS